MHDAVHHERIIRFGTFELDLEGEELRRNGLRLKLTGQPFQVLAILLENPGRVVTREELQKRLWADTFVDFDHNLNTAVNKIREVLGDSAENPRFVETLPRRGYRFIGPIEAQPKESTADPSLIAQAATIAVTLSAPGTATRVPVMTQTATRVRWAIAGAAIFVLAIGLAIAGWIWLGGSRRTTPEVPLMAVPLTTYPGLALQPVFSPDGNEVAFAWNGEKEDHYNIYRKQLGPGEPLRLTTGPMGGYSPAWSPDGRYIAYYRLSPSGNAQVCVIPALGGPEQRLAEVANAEVPGAGWYTNYPHSTLAWTPNGKWLISPDLPGGGQRPGLFLISVDTGEKRRLTDHWDEYPNLSADGRTLAFVRDIDIGVADIYRLSLTESLQPQGEPERVTYENRLVQSPFWTQDGKEIVFSSGAWWGERNIRRIAVTERGGQSGYHPRATSFGEDATALAISPRSGRLAYARLSQIVNIYRLRLSGTGSAIGTPQRVTNSTRADILPSFSPDGTRVVFTSTRSGAQEIWVCDVDGQNPRQMTSIGGSLTAGASWSSDGKAILFDSRWKGPSDIYLVSADGGSPRALTKGPYYKGGAMWSRDGKWIYFHSRQSGRSEIYRMAGDGGNPIQLTKNGGFGQPPFESADGKWVYFLKEGGRLGLWKVPASGGEESRVMESVPDWGNYAVVDEGVYFLAGEWWKNANASIAFFDFASGKTKLVIQTGKPISIGLAVSRDKRWLLFTEVEHLGSDLMLVDNFR